MNYTTNTKQITTLLNLFFVTDAQKVNREDFAAVEILESVTHHANKISGDYEIDSLIEDMNLRRISFVLLGHELFIAKYYKLYRQKGYNSFAAFCEQELSFKAWQADNIIRASQANTVLITEGGFSSSKIPQNVNQAAALSVLPDEEKIAFWSNMLDKYRQSEITEKLIQKEIYFEYGYGSPPKVESPTELIEITQETYYFLICVMKMVLYVDDTKPIAAFLNKLHKCFETSGKPLTQKNLLKALISTSRIYPARINTE